MLRSEHILKGLGKPVLPCNLQIHGLYHRGSQASAHRHRERLGECVPGHYNLRRVAQRQRTAQAARPSSSASSAAATAWVRATTACTSSCPRELIANSIESMALQINLFDGLVLLGSCDKIVQAC